MARLKAAALRQRFGDGRATFVPGDLSDLIALKRDSESLAAQVDGFDFLVNNAAIDPVAPIEAYSLDEFLAVQTINAHAAFVLCQTLAPTHETQGRRRDRQRDERRPLGRLGGESPLRDVEGGIARPHALFGSRAWSVQHPRQRREPGRHSN